MQLWSYDEETDEVHPGENVKLKVSGVEEEVGMLKPGALLTNTFSLVF